MNLFVLLLLLCNFGASVWFGMHGNVPWALIYLGVAIVQLGCLIESR